MGWPTADGMRSWSAFDNEQSVPSDHSDSQLHSACYNPQMSVAHALNKLLLGLSSEVPDLLSGLAPGASSDDIDDLEDVVGTLHPDLEDLLTLHNGQQNESLINGDSLCSCEYIGEWYELLLEIEDDSSSTWTPQWVPVAGNDGDGYFMNMETGKVRHYLHDLGLHKQDCANSISELFGLMIDQIAAGNIAQSPGMIRFNLPGCWV